MSNTDPLVIELAKPEYAGLSDEDAAAVVNAKTVAYRRPAETAAVKTYAIAQGFWAAIDEACDSETASVRRLARNVRAYLEDAAGKLPTIDMDRPATIDMLAALVTAELITDAQRVELMALGDATMRWVDEQGIGTVGIGLVRNARKVMEVHNAQ